MNFPVGSVLDKGRIPFDFYSKLIELNSKKFSGYFVLAIKGNFVEEGIIFFRDGEIIGCIVECLAAEKIFKGDEALDYFFNQTRGRGFFQLIGLSRTQIDLITAFDDKLLVNKIDLKELPKRIPSVFLNKFEKYSYKLSVLESYGLSELKK